MLQSLRRAVALSCLILLLAACAIEGGVQQAATTAPATTQPLATSAAVAESLTQRRDTWAIGLQDQPEDLYPYAANAAAGRAAAPVLELLYPAPILAHGYTYTVTGVLDRLPTFENGDIEVRKADVYLDVAGNITTTVTEVMTQVDQLAVTFRWNPKLRWSDGQPVTADDSIFAYEQARAAPPGDEARDRLAQIVAYEKVDEHTTRAVLQPDVIGPTAFLTYWTPLPRHLLKNVAPDQVRASDFARAPVGYGPYAIEQVRPGQIQLARNPYYFGSAPAASRLTLTFTPDVDRLRANVLNGSLDVAALDRIAPDQFTFLDQDSRAGLATVTYLPGPIWEHIDFNLDVATLQDIRVRHAIAMATNRKGIVDELYQGRVPVLDSWVLPEQAESAPPDQIARYDYNPDEARRLLDEAGYTDPDGDGIRVSPDGVTLTLQLLTTEKSPIRQEIASRFQRDLAAVGVRVEALTISASELFAPQGPLFQRQFELALYAWIAGPDPGGLLLWSCAAVPNENNGWTGDNFSGWCFRDADRAIREAATTLDPSQRKAAYLRQQQLWTQELPSLPLFQRLSTTIVAPGVHGPQPDPLAPITWNVAAWRRK